MELQTKIRGHIHGNITAVLYNTYIFIDYFQLGHQGIVETHDR
jgi:hypothetical protein